MKSEIITIGDEILIGQVINTNAAFIGEKLLTVGIKIDKVTTIGDSENILLETFQRSFNENDLIIITGGLGPTHDDITKKTLAKYFNAKLVLNNEVLGHVKNIFDKRKIPMSPINEEQALVPENCLVIHNEFGTASGMHFKIDEKDIFVMPGVPFEMKPIVEKFILPYLKNKYRSHIQVKTLLTTGIPESSLFTLLGDINNLTKNAELAFLPSYHGVKVRIIVKSDNDVFAIRELKRIESIIREKAGEYIFGEGDIELEAVIGTLLKEKNLKISVAESCTGGIIANRITNISGSSEYFERGVVTYSNKSKVDLLKVPEEIINEKGAVSEEVAKLMAENIKNISGSDIGISTTGIAGPTGGTDLKPVGLVFIGYSDKNGTFTKSYNFATSRTVFKERVSQTVFNILRKKLLS